MFVLTATNSITLIRIPMMIKLSISLRRLTIKLEIVRNLVMLDRVLADIPNQSADTLVDGMERREEEQYSYEHYYGTQKHQVFTPSFR